MLPSVGIHPEVIQYFAGTIFFPFGSLWQNASFFYVSYWLATEKHFKLFKFPDSDIR
jgi:hypothetical protein